MSISEIALPGYQLVDDRWFPSSSSNALASFRSPVSNPQWPSCRSRRALRGLHR